MVEIQVPPLRDREEDLPLLIEYLLRGFSHEFCNEIHGLTQRASLVLARHNWPGNVRELENVIGHGCMMTVSDMAGVQDLLQAPSDTALARTVRFGNNRKNGHQSGRALSKFPQNLVVPIPRHTCQKSNFQTCSRPAVPSRERSLTTIVKMLTRTSQIHPIASTCRL
jgi:transcriptional regulator with PAS, ATPase and Fis domain